MIRKTTCLPLVLAVAFLGACETAPTQQSAVTTTDTATEVALFGLVSWANRPDPADSDKLQVFALMPSTTDEQNQLKEPQCLGDEPPPMQHYPVLKLVTYEAPYIWKDNKALTSVATDVFSIAGQDITIEDNGFFDPVTMDNFGQLSSDASLEATRSGDFTTPFQKASLDSTLLGTLNGRDPRLAARVLFTRGRVQAMVNEYCDSEPLDYLAEANTTGGGKPETGCPIFETISRKNLAEEVVAKMHSTGRTLTIHFHEWSTGTQRTLTVSASSATGGVRIELSNQMEVAAKEIDSRKKDSIFCDEGDLRDYLWYYDLRDSPAADCSDLKPAFFPCDAGGTGGTKCPEHNWGP